MTLADVIERIARRQEVPVTLAGGFILEAIDEIACALDAGEDVKIRGLGTLCRKTVSARPGSGITQDNIPAGKKLRFIPARKLRTRRR